MKPILLSFIMYKNKRIKFTVKLKFVESNPFQQNPHQLHVAIEMNKEVLSFIIMWFCHTPQLPIFGIADL